ncbi:MAG: hypothetical protein A2W21_10155 [Betaproteobacteria bacterium RBG_16_66_20]|nr:MAG: hypothetical protein A2W21_10155 [Betaproteobacteria bacterium RBG_16_66_20]
MKKKIAVLVRDRQDEALRMALGLVLADDEVDVYVLDRKLADTEAVRLYLTTLKEFEFRVFTNQADNEGLEYLSVEQIAQRLPQYDHTLPY